MSDLPQQQRVLSPRQQRELAVAHGKVHVLCIGITDYSTSSGFSTLKVSVNDAVGVANCFRDVKELNADPKHITVLTSQQSPVSRGAIIKAVHNLATNAEEDDRVLLYFSGHGHRLDSAGDKFYLVPEDVFRPERADTLLEFSTLLETLKESPAKQKITIIDACFSGPSDLKRPLSALTPHQLSQYLDRTEGVAILASSSADEASFAKCPGNERMSLFTYALIKALHGDPDALRDRFLTINSLFDYVCDVVIRQSKSFGTLQTPVRKVLEEGGSIVLADFNTALIQSPELDFHATPVVGVDFDTWEKGRVDEVLTSIRNWNYSVEWLERRVKEDLGDHLAETLGKIACDLSNEVGFAISDVNVEGAGVTFPGGTYSVRYES